MPNSSASPTKSPSKNPTKSPIKSSTTKTSVLLMTALSLGLVLGVAGLATTLAGRTLPRLDLTASASAGLSPRSKQALAGLAGPTRIIIAGDLRNADPKARRALTDVLDELRASSPLLSVLTVDTTSETGLDDYRAVLQSLHEREASQMDGATTLAKQAAATGAAAASELASARAPLAGLRDLLARAAPTSQVTLPVLRGIVEQGPGVLATREKDLQALAEAIRPALEQRIVDVPVPALEQARSLLLAPATAARQDARTLLGEIAKVNADQGTTSEARSLLSQLASHLTRAADIADGLQTQASALPRLDIARVAEALARGSAGLIVGPQLPTGNADGASSLIAIDLRSLLPDGVVLEAAQASKTDLQRRVEDVLSTSLASLAAGAKPLLVVTHADPPGAVLGTRLFDAAVERLALRGIDTIEWSVVGEDEPKATDLDPKALRPRVYLVIAPDASAQANATGLTGSQRVQQMATKLRDVLKAQGSDPSLAPRSLLLCIAPSILPTYGSPDPLAQLAEEFGIRVQSGEPLLTEVLTPQGRSVETDRLVQPIEGDAPLQLALRGLPTYVTWATPMERIDAPGTTVLPLLGVPSGQAASSAGARTWAESQWQRLRSVRREDRALLPAAQLPTPDPQRERLAPAAFAGADGQWVVAAAGERAAEPGSQAQGAAKPQRLVVVGTNDWAIDPVTQQGRVVDGRPVLQNPGNLELLDASVHWLAHQDNLIAQSASATVAPMVRAIDDSSLRLVRIATIAGLPLLVLLTGITIRLLRK